MTPADIRRQVVVEELDLSADGRLAVVARRSVRGDRYVTHLYAIPLDEGRTAQPRRLTSGLVRDGHPRLSPDGRAVAFVRSDPSDAVAITRIVILDLRSGRQRALTTRGHGSVGEVAWSPDGRRLAFTAKVDPPRFLVGPLPSVDAGRPRRRRAADAAAEPSPLARRITRADWRWDGTGHLDRWSHLFVVEARRGAGARQVTAGDWGVAGVCWAPDGRTVAFTADLGGTADTRPRPTIWATDVDAPGGLGVATPCPVLAPDGFANHPAYSPDGRWLAAIGVLEADPVDDVSPGILVGPADGSSPPWALAPELDRPIGNWTDTDLNGWMVSGRPGPCWMDPGTIVAIVSDRGRSHPVRFHLDPRTGAPLAPPAATPRDASGPWSDATSHTLAIARTGTVAVLGTLGTRAMEMMTLDEDGAGRPRWTTRSTLGSAWQRRYDRPQMRRLDAPGPGGPIETWVASPADAGDAALPTVVDVHGGPLGAWAPAPHLEVSLLAARGFRVVLPNIRGSTSYGRDWIRPQLGDWGGVDAADVHAALDHVVALGLADPARLGVLGLSYGGFMVNWLVGTTDRFRAAVSENGVTNQVSGWANSDSGPEYDRASLMGDPLSPEGIERLWRQSPLRHVAGIRTPLLMLQAEADLRCPPQDNEQLFIALRHLGRTVEYVLYPDESHVYASSGRPDRRIDRMTRMLDWFDRYLRA
jgi:dipeptidyl aminopeptidase/acylaminoacyl peptidase